MMLIPLILTSWFIVIIPRTSYQVDKLFWTRVHASDAASVTISIRAEHVQDPILDRDTGSGLTFEQDRPRLNQFAADLKKVPNSTAYIIAYGGAVGPVREAKIRLKCIEQYLKNRHRISPSRLVMIDGGYRSEISVEFFLVTASDSKPEPAPTVKPSSVRIINARRHRCR